MIRDTNQTVLAIIYFNLRHGLSHLAVEEAEKQLRVQANDGFMLFWRACSFGLSGHEQKAIHALTSMKKTHRRLQYATLSALIWFHEQSNLLDEDEISGLRLSLSVAEKCANAEGLILASNFHIHVGNIEEAQEILDSDYFETVRPNQSNGNSETLILEEHRIRLLLKLYDVDDEEDSHEREIPDMIIRNANTKSIDTFPVLDYLMLKAKFCAKNEEYLDAIKYYNEIIGKNALFFPALIEKGKLHLQMKKYHELKGLVEEAMVKSNEHFEALLLLTMYQYLAGNSKSQRIENLGKIVTILKGFKTTKNDVIFHVSQFFARTCGCDKRSLDLTKSLVELICKLDPSNEEYRLEHGYHLRRLKKYNEAIADYQFSSSLDTNDSSGLQGMILAQVLNGNIEDAKAQKDFISVMGNVCARNADMIYADLLLEEDSTSIGNLLLELLHHAIKKISETNPKISDRPFRKLTSSTDLSLVLDLSVFILNSEKLEHMKNKNDIKTKLSILLNEVIKFCPACVEAWAILCKTMIEQNEFHEAKRIISKCLVHHPHSALVHLVSAQYHLFNEDFQNAQQCVEQALSVDFTIQRHTIYVLVKSKLLMNEGLYEESRTCLLGLMQSVGGTKNTNNLLDETSGSCITNLNDYALCFVYLSMVNMSLKQDEEALRVVLSAGERFQGSNQSFTLAKLSSDLHLKQGHITSALKPFDCISMSSPFFREAQLAKADVYLNGRKDKNAFIECYLRLVDECKSFDTYMILGDAYMKVHAPEDAIETYQHALTLNPKDENLVVKIGDTLISIHEFGKAVLHFETFIQRSEDNLSVRLKLATLQAKLDNDITAIDILKTIFIDLQQRKQSEKYLPILLQIVEVFSEIREHNDFKRECLQEAKDVLLSDVLAQNSSPLAMNEEDDRKHLCVSIMTALADILDSDGDHYMAEELYRDALGIIADNEGTLLAFSNHLVNSGKLEDGKKMCEQLRLNYPNNIEGMLLMCDILIRLSNINEAMNILRRESNNFESLMKYIILSHQAGCQSEIEIRLNDEKETDMGAKCVDLQVCLGVDARLRGALNDALIHFNFARTSHKWKLLCLQNMIEIYLNLDDVGFWFEPNEPPSYKHLESVSTLLRDLSKASYGADKAKAEVLRGYYEISKSSKKGLKAGKETFQSILSREKEYIPAQLGLALALKLEGAETKARNMLKRIAKLEYNPEFWREYERSYLILAEGYVSREKPDLAQELCRRCLFYNKSSIIALKLMGALEEEKGQTDEATDFYQKCWNLLTKPCPALGFKLSALYLGKKRFIEAIEVATLALPNDSSRKDSDLQKLIIDNCILQLKA